VMHEVIACCQYECHWSKSGRRLGGGLVHLSTTNQQCLNNWVGIYLSAQHFPKLRGCLTFATKLANDPCHHRLIWCPLCRRCSHYFWVCPSSHRNHVPVTRYAWKHLFTTVKGIRGGATYRVSLPPLSRHVFTQPLKHLSSLERLHLRLC